jgi:hypothetical protein
VIARHYGEGRYDELESTFRTLLKLGKAAARGGMEFYAFTFG